MSLINVVKHNKEQIFEKIDQMKENLVVMKNTKDEKYEQMLEIVDEMKQISDDLDQELVQMDAKV